MDYLPSYGELDRHAVVVAPKAVPWSPVSNPFLMLAAWPVGIQPNACDHLDCHHHRAGIAELAGRWCVGGYPIHQCHLRLVSVL